MSDGLVSNVALILGIAGASTDGSLVRLAGVSGLLAGAISMAAGEWVSFEQDELIERELEIDAVRWPATEAETRELAAIFRDRGLDPEQAAQVAEGVISVPTSPSTCTRRTRRRPDGGANLQGGAGVIRGGRDRCVGAAAPVRRRGKHRHDLVGYPGCNAAASSVGSSTLTERSRVRTAIRQSSSQYLPAVRPTRSAACGRFGFLAPGCAPATHTQHTPAGDGGAHGRTTRRRSHSRSSRPWCPSYDGRLAGADVIRVDRVAEVPAPADRTAKPYSSWDRGRRSIAVDLVTGWRGDGAAPDVGPTSSFRPGVTERLVSTEEVRRAQTRHRLRLTGWGQTGRLGADRRAFAEHEAITGVIDAIGPRDGLQYCSRFSEISPVVA